jgi:predicted phosphate transport protein (TIGR00153 family)
VALRFRPVDTGFYDLFTDQAQHLVVGAALLAEMLSETAVHDDVATRMRAAEHEADETTHALFKRVNSTFVTPFDREDIYRLGSGLDDVMDMMDEVVDLILLYEVKMLPPELSQQVEVLQRCADLTAAAMPGLQSPSNLEEYWIEINRLENAGDRNHRRMLAKLFSGEFKTIEVLKLKDIVEALERAIDAFESVAHTVEQIAVKES